jgi:hypothetical protein
MMSRADLMMLLSWRAVVSDDVWFRVRAIGSFLVRVPQCVMMSKLTIGKRQLSGFPVEAL